MAWEKRSTSSKYYYIATRVDQRVVKGYVGPSTEQLAKLVAISDMLVQQERAEAKQCIAIRRDAQHA